jgi:protein-tyrosine-phosphatase
MADVGIDLSKQCQRQLTPEMVEDADKVIVLASKQECPDYLKDSKKAVFWNTENAKGKDYTFVCKRRDEIRKLVENLIRELDLVRF